jgi:TIR domain
VGENGAQTDYDVFMSHSRGDAQYVTALAETLVDDHGLKPWVDAWVLSGGDDWQEKMALALEQVPNCLLCIGASEPEGWFKEEMQKAMNRARHDKEFRLIPVMLPNAGENARDHLKGTFLENRLWIDFREPDRDEAFRLLVCGIRRLSPGRATIGKVLDARKEKLVRHLQRLKEIAADLPPEVHLDLARKYAVEYVEADG